MRANLEDMVIAERRDTWQRDHTEVSIRQMDQLMGWLHKNGPQDFYVRFQDFMNTVYHSPRRGARHSSTSLVRLPDSMLFDILSYTLQALWYAQPDDKTLKLIRGIWTAVKRAKRNSLLEHHAKRMLNQGYTRTRIQFGTTLSLNREPDHATVQ